MSLVQCYNGNNCESYQLDRVFFSRKCLDSRMGFFIKPPSVISQDHILDPLYCMLPQIQEMTAIQQMTKKKKGKWLCGGEVLKSWTHCRGNMGVTTYQRIFHRHSKMFLRITGCQFICHVQSESDCMKYKCLRKRVVNMHWTTHSGRIKKPGGSKIYNHGRVGQYIMSKTR